MDPRRFRGGRLVAPTGAARRYARRFGALAALGAGLAACADASTAPAGGLERPLTAVEQQAVTAGNQFSFALLREVNARKAGRNVFVSPLSASVALAMAANGAAGETEAAMRRTLGMGGRSAEEANAAYHELARALTRMDPAVTFTSANAIWYREGLAVQPAFLEVSRAFFDAEVRGLNFAAPDRALPVINGWARGRTNGKIERVIESISPNDVMFLMNALYFKGAWRTRFDPQRTRPDHFTRDDGTRVPVQMMSLPETRLRVGGVRGVLALELPYGSGAYSMLVLLPNPGMSVDALVAGLDVARWDELLASLAEREVGVMLPRFRIAFDDTLNAPLTALGMGIAFSPRQADFSRIAPGGLYLSYVKQSAVVEVNEEGTEAAAVTTVGVRQTSAGPAPFRVDRPFAFAIHERNTGAILFLGKVSDLPGL